MREVVLSLVIFGDRQVLGVECDVVLTVLCWYRGLSLVARTLSRSRSGRCEAEMDNSLRRGGREREGKE